MKVIALPHKPFYSTATNICSGSYPLQQIESSLQDLPIVYNNKCISFLIANKAVSMALSALFEA